MVKGDDTLAKKYQLPIFQSSGWRGLTGEATQLPEFHCNDNTVGFVILSLIGERELFCQQLQVDSYNITSKNKKSLTVSEVWFHYTFFKRLLRAGWVMPSNWLPWTGCLWFA